MKTSEKRKAYQKAYRLINRKRITQRWKEWREKNADHVRKYKKEWMRRARAEGRDRWLNEQRARSKWRRQKGLSNYQPKSGKHGTH